MFQNGIRNRVHPVAEIREICLEVTKDRHFATYECTVQQRPVGSKV